MNPVVHFEMPAQDRKRAADFYTNVFGWEMRQLSPDMGHYILAMTTESDEKGPKEPGRINGGFFQKTSDNPAQHPSIVIAVDDIKLAMEKVVAEGGKVLREPMEIPGVGKYAPILDTEGNLASMLQPLQM
ncbi:MAG: VOC family protein [Planctomycetes bacterium]|nr:VOC family protein [Planctomycetota bacterium]